MTQFLGLLYVSYFIVLGYGFRAAFNLIKGEDMVIEQKTDFLAHAFFQGVFLHVVMFNVLQLFDLSASVLIGLVTITFIACLAAIGQHIRSGGFKSQTIKPKPHNLLVTVTLLLFSLFIYWNGVLLPNIAWDSWAVWFGKAQQWINHGLHTQILQWEAWLQAEGALFNPSANYPDGLSLIFYWPELLFGSGFAITHVVLLFAFAMMTLLLTSRIEKTGAPIYFQLFLIVVLYTTPFINNHLMILGYADIWIAMFVVLIMLSLMDFVDDRNSGVGLTILCYLVMLPMLKLEGWVWLILFVLAYLISWLLKHHNRFKIMITISVLIVLLLLAGGIHLSLPFGDLIISHERITLFNLFDMKLAFVDISDALLVSFFWQNNWSLLWLGLPFLLYTFFNTQHSLASQVSHIFLILALACFMFLFFFTEASQWAQDLTAINRVVLQLTPCYVFLLFKMLSSLVIPKPDTEQQQTQ